MRISYNVFWVICAFFVTAGVIYTVFEMLDTGDIEWLGTIGLLFIGIMGAFIAFFLQKAFKEQAGAVLPSDNETANIDDADPELGFFSPWSWWPMILAGGAGLFIMGLAVGFWICFIGGALALVALIGWIFEYYRGLFAR